MVSGQIVKSVFVFVKKPNNGQKKDQNIYPATSLSYHFELDIVLWVLREVLNICLSMFIFTLNQSEGQLAKCPTGPLVAG